MEDCCSCERRSHGRDGPRRAMRGASHLGKPPMGRGRRSAPKAGRCFLRIPRAASRSAPSLARRFPPSRPPPAAFASGVNRCRFPGSDSAPHSAFCPWNRPGREKVAVAVAVPNRSIRKAPAALHLLAVSCNSWPASVINTEREIIRVGWGGLPKPTCFGDGKTTLREEGAMVGLGVQVFA